MPVEVVKRTLDGMAAVKLNVFHWHLSDDQGFRIESRRFPKLQELGSDGLFYTQEQVRDVIAYARDRGIRVVPEFDVPGHTTSWVVGYPELASAPGPYAIERRWGGFDPTLDPTRESTYQFLDTFFGEMAELFPDQFFHIGGDEVNGVQWNASAAIRAFLAEHQMKDAHALQAYFNRRVEAILEKHGKRMEGWDEILDPDLPKSIVIQSWRGQKSLADAARLGYAGILSSGYYLDHMEPSATLYGVDPLAGDSDALTPEGKSRVLGGEVAMWAEFVDPENVDSRIWPRAAAVAERLWSPAEVRDTRDLYRRLGPVNFELEMLGLTNRTSYELMLARLSGGALFEPLKVFADVLEPGSLGQRQRARKYTQGTPLNRLVDAVRPESAVAREFAAAVGSGDRAQMRNWLMQWHDNDARLAPVLANSLLIREDAVLSKELSRLGAIGLEALDFREQGRRPTARWIAEQRAFLTNAAKVQAELRIAIVPSIQKLVEEAAH
jgi:hexosaminidase